MADVSFDQELLNVGRQQLAELQRLGRGAELAAHRPTPPVMSGQQLPPPFDPNAGLNRPGALPVGIGGKLPTAEDLGWKPPVPPMPAPRTIDPAAGIGARQGVGPRPFAEQLKGLEDQNKSVRGSNVQLGRFESGLNRAAVGLLALQPAMVGFHQVMSLARQGWSESMRDLAVANPNAAGTMEKSEQLFQAVHGQRNVGLANLQARADQALAGNERRMPEEYRVPGPAKFGGLPNIGPSFFANELDKRLSEENQQRMRSLAKGAKEYTGINALMGTKAPELQSLEGLPSPSITSGEKYADQIQLAGLGQGALEAQILQEQVKNMSQTNQLIQDVNQSLREMKDALPRSGWR